MADEGSFSFLAHHLPCREGFQKGRKDVALTALDNAGSQKANRSWILILSSGAQ